MTNLTIFSGAINDEIITNEKNYKSTHKPFTRHKNIIKALSEIYDNTTFVFQNNTIEEIEKEVESSNLVDSRYLKFLKNAYLSYIQSDQDPSYMSEYDFGLVAYYFSKEPVKCLDKLPYYLQCGVYTSDRETSIFDYTYNAALQSAYNSLLVNKMNLKDTDVVYCCNVLPGHHSTNNGYNGYCFLNNAAILASLLLEKYNKVAILDLDFHHGDGTQKIFENNNKVLTVSLHGDPSNIYPFYTGYTDENSIERCNYNYPLNKKTNVNDYLQCLKIAIKVISEYQPDVLIIPFGADTVSSDPQGSFDLNIKDYSVIGTMIKENFNTPIIVTQEGGYDISCVSTVVINFISGLVNK
jgi:acetoin utilization deacetylase AcuC-like enzyme